MLTPAVNSTTQPYGRVQDYKPCFQYASFDKTETTADGRWIVDQNEPYSEPEVFSLQGSVLNLTDYVYAYGNAISDPAYAPFTIDVLAAAEIQVSDSLTH